MTEKKDDYMKGRIRAEVLRQERIAPEIFRLVISASFAKECGAGQFVSVYSADRSRLLPRPISICESDDETVTLVYRIAGEGTREFSCLKAGDAVDVMGPLGNGFPVGEAAGKRTLLIGGGIGIPPMIAAGAAVRKAGECKSLTFACGYRSELFLTEEMKRYGDLIVATEDGSFGTKGTVIDALREDPAGADLIFACGPRPMLKAVCDYAEERRIPCWISMEERMACGVGACLGCVCGSAETDGHSFVKNKRVCKDGPVFKAGEVIL